MSFECTESYRAFCFKRFKEKWLIKQKRSPQVGIFWLAYIFSKNLLFHFRFDLSLHNAYFSDDKSEKH